MDNLFDYLIILFFIFSAIGSLFKKKPVPKSKLPKTDSAKKYDPFSYNENSGFDNPFDLGKNKNYDSHKEADDYYDKSEAFDEKFLKSSEGINPVKRTVPIQTNVSSDTVYKNNRLNKVIEISSVRNRLKDKNSVKESVLIAEILNKPKALRYSGKNLYY